MQILYTDLVRILYFGRRAIAESLHCLDWRVAKIGRFSIHHLYHHDSQRPDINLYKYKYCVSVCSRKKEVLMSSKMNGICPNEKQKSEEVLQAKQKMKMIAGEH